ncbi:MAG: hypothetical protein HY815_09295 [Candidatus Riflebacteria bacterium]|nr:hypothetical protein [Candidatus Riflebacteria bacterium]
MTIDGCATDRIRRTIRGAYRDRPDCWKRDCTGLDDPLVLVAERDSTLEWSMAARFLVSHGQALSFEAEEAWVRNLRRLGRLIRTLALIKLAREGALVSTQAWRAAREREAPGDSLKDLDGALERARSERDRIYRLVWDALGEPGANLARLLAAGSPPGRAGGGGGGQDEPSEGPPDPEGAARLRWIVRRVLGFHPGGAFLDQHVLGTLGDLTRVDGLSSELYRTLAGSARPGGAGLHEPSFDAFRELLVRAWPLVSRKREPVTDRTVRRVLSFWLFLMDPDHWPFLKNQTWVTLLSPDPELTREPFTAARYLAIADHARRAVVTLRDVGARDMIDLATGLYLASRSREEPGRAGRSGAGQSTRGAAQARPASTSPGGAQAGPPDPERPSAGPAPAVPEVAAPAAGADRPPEPLCMAMSWTTQLEAALGVALSTRQIILHGVPGTGRTRMAHFLAAALLGGERWLSAGDEEVHRFLEEEGKQRDSLARRSQRFGLVVFPRCCPCERLVGAALPRTVSETGRPEIQEGPFLRLCAAANREADPTRRYVLVVDEIVRTGLSTFLGELLYALEYRGLPVELPCRRPVDGGAGESPFRVPRNLFIIGTMGALDRADGPVDLAGCRRFALYPVWPDPDAVRSLWRDLGDAATGERLAALMTGLNERLARVDTSLGVGQSYFFPYPGSDRPRDSVLTRINYQLLPLLEGYERLHPGAGNLAVPRAPFVDLDQVFRWMESSRRAGPP